MWFCKSKGIVEQAEKNVEVVEGFTGGCWSFWVDSKSGKRTSRRENTEWGDAYAYWCNVPTFPSYTHHNIVTLNEGERNNREVVSGCQSHMLAGRRVHSQPLGQQPCPMLHLCTFSNVLD
jgi:hypothetical protein